MTKKLQKIGFGGGCHWCTEAVFQHVEGVSHVEQGWIASIHPNNSLSEAVIVHYDPDQVTLSHLIKVHLVTHSSTSNHSMRNKYRSAIYYFNEESKVLAQDHINRESQSGLVTQILPFDKFKANEENYIDYYKKNPDSPFCTRYIEPKLEKLKSLEKL